MVKKKPVRRTPKAVAKKKPSSKKAPKKTKGAVRSKTAISKKVTSKKPTKKTSSKKRVLKPKEPRSPEPSTLAPGTVAREAPRSRKGRSSGSVVQSGDLQGLSTREFADSESVEELAAEGQSHEAEVVSGVENAWDPDEGEVHTHEVLADDVPNEYLDED
jgi:hypothetical protein